ncbi:hypothetical protein EXIGLDRAFT_755738 [Exidia glandulosa HHB12029]|uniref:Uncharacterized protein n=1 Tax=Exidia glandulosa HHB12029 TaxID=1314781 RepID=A0A165ZBC6_EXIGL|nr:hypothetical protein EXIGLDRAFT_755738 [Exidia glandulosa HHB12029]
MAAEKTTTESLQADCSQTRGRCCCCQRSYIPPSCTDITHTHPIHSPSPQTNTLPPYTKRALAEPLATALIPPPADADIPPSDRWAYDRCRHNFALYGMPYDALLNVYLWNPSVVELGAVGYVDRNTGAFVTLFLAHRPETFPQALISRGASYLCGGSSRNGELPSLSERPPLAKPLPTASGIFGLPMSRKKGYTWPFSRQMRDEKKGFVCTVMHTSIHTKLDNQTVASATAWLLTHTDAIREVYGLDDQSTHKKELMIVTRRLQVNKWAMVCKDAYDVDDSKVRFLVDDSPRPGQEWGSFCRRYTDKMPYPGVSRISRRPLHKQPEAKWDTLLLSGVTCSRN